jgi:putative chitinase
MPKTKQTNKTQTSKVVNNNLFPQIKWGESYTSLFLGIVVVVVAAILVFSFLKGRNFNNSQTQSTSTSQEQIGKTLPKTYEVKEGDDLWTISEKVYGSGYNWVDLASANKLENPGVIYVGTKLTVPDVKVKVVENTAVQKTVTENTITGATYTVVKGDYLWSIAIRAYGDGYKWVEIAKANNLANPDIIHSGNVLKLPR